MKSTLFILSVLFLLSGLITMGCNQDQFRCDKGEDFHFIENSSLIIDTSALSPKAPELTSGQQIAFRYERWNDCQNVIDDEVYEMMVFEISPDTESFSFQTEEEMIEAGVYFYRTGAWFQFLVPVFEGIISGHKISNNAWELEVDVTIRFDNPDQNLYREVTFKEKFNRD